MVRRKVMFPRKEAWSTLWKSAPFEPSTGVDAFRLHGASTSVSSHFGVPQYWSHAIRYPGKLATRTCLLNGNGGFVDPVPARPIHLAPARSPSLQEPSASDGQVIA